MKGNYFSKFVVDIYAFGHPASISLSPGSSDPIFLLGEALKLLTLYISASSDLVLLCSSLGEWTYDLELANKSIVSI